MITIDLPKHITPVKARQWCKKKIGPSAWYSDTARLDMNFWTADNGSWRMRSFNGPGYNDVRWVLYFQNEQDATLFSLEML